MSRPRLPDQIDRTEPSVRDARRVRDDALIPVTSSRGTEFRLPPPDARSSGLPKLVAGAVCLCITVFGAMSILSGDDAAVGDEVVPVEEPEEDIRDLFTEVGPEPVDGAEAGNTPG